MKTLANLGGQIALVQIPMYYLVRFNLFWFLGFFFLSKCLLGYCEIICYASSHFSIRDPCFFLLICKSFLYITSLSHLLQISPRYNSNLWLLLQFMQTTLACERKN